MGEEWSVEIKCLTQYVFVFHTWLREADKAAWSDCLNRSLFPDHIAEPALLGHAEGRQSAKHSIHGGQQSLRLALDDCRATRYS